jgi:synaptobrevin family protein YKT6
LFRQRANPWQVLQRGEKLDDLVAKSSDLSAQSKMFYKSAKKQNSCCIVM